MSKNEDETGPLACPVCGKANDSASGIDHSERPRDGDVSICIQCAGISVFTLTDGVLGIRLPTDVEAFAFAGEPELQKSREAVLIMHLLSDD